MAKISGRRPVTALSGRETSGEVLSGGEMTTVVSGRRLPLLTGRRPETLIIGKPRRQS